MDGKAGEAVANNHTFENAKLTDGTERTALIVSANIIISIFIVVSNCLVLWTVYKVESLRTVTSMFIVNVSVIDLLTGCVLIPMALLTDFIIPLLREIYLPNKLVCIARTFLLSTFYGLSVFGFIGIAIERYVAIVYPLRYVTLMTVSKAKVIICNIWIYILALTVMMFIDDLNDYQLGEECVLKNILHPSYFTFIRLNILIPICVIIVLYVKITWVSLKHRSKIISILASVDNAAAVAYKNEHSVFRATTIVNVVFMIMYGQVLAVTSVKLDPEPEWYKTLFHLSIAIMRLNSGVNPWILFFSHKKYKKAFLLALKRRTVGELVD